MLEHETRPHVAQPYSRPQELIDGGLALNEAQCDKLLLALDTAADHYDTQYPFTSLALRRIAVRVRANEDPYAIGVYVASALQEMEALMPKRVI